MERTYFHVDMDAFFVSVEELYDPSLKGKPVVVGGKANERGVVAAASYAARKFGVHSAMPLRTAVKLCPQAVFVEGHPERYREYSGRVHTVLEKFSPLVEMASIDEAYLDMTGTERLHGPALQAAHLLHETMKRETKLNCSIGIAGARVVAKICSDQAKPNGVLWIVPGAEAAFLAPLEIRRMPGVGKVTEQKLQEMGIQLVGDLAKWDVEKVREELGEWAATLAEKARGTDAGGWYDTAIGENSDTKSISHEHTFSRDEGDAQALESMLARLSEMVCRRLREQKLHARKIELKLRFADFTTITRGRTVEHPTQLDTEVFGIVRELFRANRKAGSMIRLLGVKVASFEDAPAEQLALLDAGRDDRMRTALTTMDKLRDKFGENAVSLATGMKARFREKTHDNPAALPGRKPSALSSQQSAKTKDKGEEQ